MANALEVEITVGQWLPTGWGAQHLVRSFTDTHVVLACHGAGADQRAERDRVQVGNDDEPRCTSCERAGGSDGLGPAPRGVVGEVRRTPEGLIAVCVADLAGVGKWRFVGAEPVHSHGRCEDWYMGNAERITTIPGSAADDSRPERPKSSPVVVDVHLPAGNVSDAEAVRRIKVAALLEARDAARAARRLCYAEGREQEVIRHWGGMAGWLASRAKAIEAGQEPDWPDAAYMTTIGDAEESSDVQQGSA